MAGKFQGVDFYDVDSLLSEEERMVRDTIREWVEDRVLPIIADAYMEYRFPEELIPEMAEMGVLGANLPEEYGCAGLNNVSYGLMMQELERGDSGIRSFASVQGSLVMWPIFTYGTEEQRKEWLPKMASGEKIGCFGLTEPDYGSNPGGMITTAKKTSDGWGDSDSIRGFVVPTDTPGFSASDQKGKLSLKASDTSELALQDVNLPDSALMPGSDIGLRAPLSCLTQARYGIAWGVVGAAMGCYHEALGYGLERVMFGGPIAGKQIQQVRLAEMLTSITQGQLLALQLGRLKDRGEATPSRVSMAKRANVDMACEVAREARRLLGANGILVEYSAMRHMANLESVYTYEGTHDMHALILGEKITGISAF